MRASHSPIAGMFVLLLPLAACDVQGDAELQDWVCPNGECNACIDDAECVIAHNPCQPTAYCGHVDDDVAVTAEGCSAALEYGTPPDSACTCNSTATCSASLP